MLKLLVIWAALFVGVEILGQGAYGDTYRGRFYRQAHMQGEQTYLTFSDGVGNLEPLLLEAHYAARYGIVNNGKPWALTTNPKVILRMANDKSFPLRPASYHVDLTYHRMLDNSIMEGGESSVYLGIEHHSNGQSGTFFLPGDTIINTINGNFAQNYFEFGFTEYRNSNTDETHLRFRYFGIFARITPAFSARWSGHETLDRYGFYRPFLRFGIGGVREGHREGFLVKLREHSQIKMDLGYIFGEMADTGVGDIQRRGILDLQYHYVLPFFPDMSVMLRCYHGQDYYNIRFNDTVTAFTFGFSSNFATMKGAMRHLRD